MSDQIDQLTKLNELKASGALTWEEELLRFIVLHRVELAQAPAAI